MEIGQGLIGAEGQWEVDVQDGKLILKGTHKHASGEIIIEVKEDLKYFLEALRPKLPEWAQVMVNLAEASLP